MKEKTAKAEFIVPEGITAEVSGTKITFKSAGKEITKDFRSDSISFKKDNNEIKIEIKAGGRKGLSIANTVRSIMKNMATGLQKGYVYRLAIVYSHFPMNAQLKGSTIEINNFAGEKKTRKAEVVGNAKVSIKGKEITIEGISKEDVSRTASNLEQATRIRNKDNRIFQDGIYLVSKGVMQ